MIPKLHVVLRTCDQSSLQNNRIFPKNEIVTRCLKSLVTTLNNCDNTLHIIDDNSSQQTKDTIQQIAHSATFNFLPANESNQTVKQKSRHSVKVAYDYINTLPEDDLIYIVEDDYLHYPDAIEKMLKSWELFGEWSDDIDVGIFPQDFNQLYLHPNHPFNDTYIRPCIVIPGIDRYYRTTWFTHESFLIKHKVIKKYRNYFNELLEIGFVEGKWEGNSISNVWTQPDVRMMMPLGTHAVHISAETDISFFANDWRELWDSYK